MSQKGKLLNYPTEPIFVSQFSWPYCVTVYWCLLFNKLLPEQQKQFRTKYWQLRNNHRQHTECIQWKKRQQSKWYRFPSGRMMWLRSSIIFHNAESADMYRWNSLPVGERKDAGWIMNENEKHYRKKMKWQNY